MAKARKKKKGPRQYNVAAHHKKRRLTIIRDPTTRVLVARDGNDIGPEQRAAQQGGLILTDRGVAKGGVVTTQGAWAIGENVIGYLAHRGDLTPDKDAAVERYGVIETKKYRIAAAEWVLRTYRAARLTPKVVAAYQAATSKSNVVMSNGQAHAIAMLRALHEKVGHDMAMLLADVCVRDAPPPDREIPALIVGLDAVARWRRLLPTRVRMTHKDVKSS